MNKIRLGEKIATFILWIVSAISVFILIAIIGHIMIQGIPHINWEFLTEEPENMGKSGGIYSIIISTIYIVGISLVISVPIGVCAAIYLAEYAKEGKGVRIIRFTIETLAGIPSIIFGLFGMVFFVLFLKLGLSVLSGGLTLSLMILPTLIRTSEEAIRSVPREYREGSLALGASKWQTISRVVLPSALSGIITGIILGIGRAVGESAALMLTAGGTLGIPNNVLRPGRTMAVHIYIMASEGLSMQNTYGTAAVLIILIMIINFAANRAMKKMIAITSVRGQAKNG
ncbi:MAG: phosphate ABC transporter permease PstA [Clostridia bacterium]|nr:phosphate ABC transporter permease PstA [Clostridia bacterium]